MFVVFGVFVFFGAFFDSIIGSGGGVGGGGASVFFVLLTGVLRLVPSLLPAGLPRLFVAFSGNFSTFSTIISSFLELSGTLSELSPDKSNGKTSMVVIYMGMFFLFELLSFVLPRTSCSCHLHDKRTPYIADPHLCASYRLAN